MTEYRITIGDPSAPDFDFRNESINLSSISSATAVDVVGTELSIDVFNVAVEYFPDDLLFAPADYNGVFTKDGYYFGTGDEGADLIDVPYGEPLMFYKDGSVFGKFYVKNIVRTGKNRYKINAMSAIGFLENQKHYGGIYSNVTIEDMLDEIIGDAFTYSVDAAIQNEIVSGWLPISTRRANLHRLMFAMGITITKDSNGDVVFGFLEYSTPKSVGPGKVFYGGNVDYNIPATAAEVTEYSFYKLQSTEEEQLFSNLGDTTAESLLIEFKYPCYDLRTEEQLTIDSYGDNYAIVSGNGVLYGKAYTQNTRTIRKANESATGATNIVTSSEDALVNALNSENVLRRILSYYSSKKTVSIAIDSSGEKCGDVISFNDPFEESESGFISQMEIYASSFLKAALEIITNYTPTGQGNFYHNRALITANGIWTVPQGVTTIRVALIGGGGGGAGGYDGEEGAGGEYDPDWGMDGDLIPVRDRDEGYLGYRYRTDEQPLKLGGVGGDPGSPGKAYVVDKEVTPGEVITIVVGAGGAGGSRNGNLGQTGTATTAASTSIGSISSENGTATDAGYYDVLAGRAFATGGVSGYAGMPGGQTDTQSLLGWLGYAGLHGGDFDETYHGGAGGSGEHSEGTEDIPAGRWRASGGGGGGAAYGENGGNGTDGYLDEETGRDVYCGSGGKGADALPPPQAFYGCAGQGGNGGGAGGNAGGGYSDTYFSQFNDKYQNGERGQPGLGSVGGQGGAGCVIIYW